MLIVCIECEVCLEYSFCQQTHRQKDSLAFAILCIHCTLITIMHKVSLKKDTKALLLSLLCVHMWGSLSTP